MTINLVCVLIKLLKLNVWASLFALDSNFELVI